jgi:Ni/Fe-hydrogenase 1 B-type cytochrome subunit
MLCAAMHRLNASSYIPPGKTPLTVNCKLMQNENIRYILVWPGWLRLSHAVIAFGVLFQIISAWAIEVDYARHAFWHDWHLIVGQLILAALLLRVALLFLPGVSSWRTFFDYRSQLDAMLQTLKFYLSFTRLSLPGWYAHNPLWKPFYLLVLLALAASAATGLIMDTQDFLLGFSVNRLHRSLAVFITLFTGLHILTTLLHDWKGKGAFISAIINGHRYFHYRDVTDTGNEDTAVHISVASIARDKNKPE